MIRRSYADYAWEQAAALLAIDSPTGFTARAAQWVYNAFKELGCDAQITTKGGILVNLGGTGEGLVLEAHADTLGAIVSKIKGNGNLQLSPLGGMNANNAEAENVRIYTREGTVIEGTAQLCNASIHVNGDYKTTQRSFDTLEVVPDADIRSKEDALKLGIQVGDMVCFDPRTRRTETGYLKSRFLDDKLCVGILLALAKYIKDEAVPLNRQLWAYVTVFEEVGHGGSSAIPDGVTEIISVDMGCVGEGLECTERKVSICAKDSGGPYHYDVVGKLIAAAKAAGCDYAVDVYPFYGSDAEASLRAGYDVRHGLIGPGVYASHGYERSHIDGVDNTLKLLCSYIANR